MLNQTNDVLIIIGGGPSAKELDFKRIEDKFTFGLNFVCHFFEPTALVWVDNDFYAINKQKIDSLKCVKITKARNEVPLDIIRLQDSDVFYAQDGLQSGLYSAYLVGMFSLSLGIALGFKEIYLLGYDCGFSKSTTGESISHFHDIDHRGRTNERPYINKLYKWDKFKGQKNIYNVSLTSNLEIFPKISYTEFYNRINNCEVNQIEARSWLTNNLIKYNRIPKSRRISVM